MKSEIYATMDDLREIIRCVDHVGKVKIEYESDDFGYQIAVTKQSYGNGLNISQRSVVVNRRYK